MMETAVEAKEKAERDGYDAVMCCAQCGWDAVDRSVRHGEYENGVFRRHETLIFPADASVGDMELLAWEWA